MIKEIVYSVLYNHPDKPTGRVTWSTNYPDKMEFKDIDKHLQLLKEKNKAIYAKIITCTVEVDKDNYFDFDESIKETEYEWYDGKSIVKIKETEFKK